MPVTKQEMQEYVQKRQLPQDAYNTMTPAEIERWRFLVRQDNSWADKYGGTIPYYPQRRYIAQNLAPEQDITRSQLEAFAQANEIARSSGLLSPKLADRMLPTLLTESATGINNWGYPDKEPYRSILTKAGLPPTLEEINAAFPSKGTDYDRELHKSKLMHALMAAKAHQYGDDLAIERWNGRGSGVGRGGRADAPNHARKVFELEELLQHPKNKEMMDTWADFRAKHSQGQDVTSMKAAPEAPETWEERNLPTMLSRPITAAREALSGLSMKNAQNAVRDWTAPSLVPENKKKGGFVDKPLQGGSKLI